MKLVSCEAREVCICIEEDWVLGSLTGVGKIRMDRMRIQAIKDPKKLQFVKGYSEVVSH